MKCRFFAGALCAAAMLGTAASAAVELDQSSIPAYPGGVAVQGTGLPAGAVHGQTFTVGLDGRLSALELAISVRDEDGSGSLGLSLQRMDGEELFATQILGARPANSIRNWWYDFPIDLTAADILVKAGDQFKIVLTSGPGSANGDFAWYYMSRGVPFSYGGGTAFVDDSYYHEFDFDYGFRTYVDTSAVPEPAAWALMIVGFAGTGVALRRSRRFGAQTA